MNSGNLIVADAEFLNASKECRRYADELEVIIREYIAALYILYNGINDELIHNNIGTILIQARKYPTMLEEVVSEANKLMESYVQEIDTADNFIY